MKLLSLTLVVFMLFISFSFVACGGGGGESIPTPEEGMEKSEPVGAREAYSIALLKAEKWNPDAKLYQISGQEIKLDGTAWFWEVCFATKLDEQGGSMGDKYVVTIKGGKVSDTHESTLGVCTNFLPDSWIDSQEAHPACYNALTIKHGEDASTYEISGLVCQCYDPYYTFFQEISMPKGTPYWDMQFYSNNQLRHALIDAVSGEVIAVE